MKRQLYMIQKGFTLVELLIVVIILAILAAIVVPQFAASTDDAKVSSLDTTLSNMRAAIDLYKQQHGEYPGDKTAAGATCPNSGTAAVVGATTGTEEAFLAQMSMYTDKDGLACSTTDATFKFGPYMKKDYMGDNPITNDNTLDVKTAGNLNMTADTAKGWQYDTKTGKFIADDDTDPDGAGPLLSYDQH